MRRILILALACILACGGASAQLAGNLSNDGFVDAANGAVYVAANDGILKIEQDKVTTLTDDVAGMLTLSGDRLYYVKDTMGENEYGDYDVLARSIMSIDLATGDTAEIGPGKRVGFESDYDNHVFDNYVGYAGVTVYGDRIYYLANSGQSGSYTCNANGDAGGLANESITATYNDAISLYSMALDGSDVREIIPKIGNDQCYFSIEDDNIYLAGCFADLLYAYCYVNLSVYTLDGQLVNTYDNPEDEPFFSEAGQYYMLPTACFAQDGVMYVSVRFSEGDFRQAELYRVNKDGTFVSQAMLDGEICGVMYNGELYYVGNASGEVYYDEDFDYAASEGIYKKKLDDTGLGTKLAALSPDEVYGLGISVADDFVYYKNSDGDLFRLPVEGGEAVKLGVNGF